jgi:hypothetical protein
VTTRRVRTKSDKPALVAYVSNLSPPYTVKFTQGLDRSAEQNRLQWLWANELAEQFGDMSAAEYQAFFKLHFGVPILRADDDDFREIYDRMMKPQAYEDKLKFMLHGGFSVSSLMTTKQMTQYLDAIYTEFTGRGALLTRPDEGTW